MEIPTTMLPVLATRNLVVFPSNSLHLNIGRTKSSTAIQHALDHDRMVIALAQKQPVDDTLQPGAADLHRVGVICKIEKYTGSLETGFQILLRGVSRVNVTELSEAHGMIMAATEALEDQNDCDEPTIATLSDNLKQLSLSVLKYVPADTRQLEELLEGITSHSYLCNLVAEHVDTTLEIKQEILEMTSVKQRFLKLLSLLQAQKENFKLQHEIREKLSFKLGKAQREQILREQMRTIKEELGEGAPEAGDYSTKIEAAKFPEAVKKVALEEARRLGSMGPSAPEAHVIQNYLDLLLSLPWEAEPDAEIDLEAARKVLDADHYGLAKIKKRVIQHLAVMKLKKSHKGTLLLFVGPPGVGKTSLGQSIAKALGRKFVRISLGGGRDESEIRGHRRTYIGAMPGRIIQGIKRAGTMNPVILLDEIDKLNRSYNGDPAGALLEVLDSEQNQSFQDHYLDVPYDLSRVIFIATANTLESIPGPLLDRMEVVELSGYTTPEKFHIAKSHLLPKQLAEHGLSPALLGIEDEALMRVITHYTREAGVRDLARKLSELCRASSEKVLAAAEELVTIGVKDLEEQLGPERFVHEVIEKVMPVGVATGLAWTPLGGEILFIEGKGMPGSGKLILTGQLGEVMKESAQIALSLVRSNIVSQAVSQFDFNKTDLHIHVPQGAIPKDGPSAGITLLTALASLCTGRSVSPKLAMTGEITLRGAVMPVGGVKEKVLAAHRAGITHILMSKRNERDLYEVPAEVRAQVKIDFVDTVQDVLRLALGLEGPNGLVPAINVGMDTAAAVHPGAH